MDDKVIKDGITEDLLKIYKLKKTIAKYDNNWELIQICTPAEILKSFKFCLEKNEPFNQHFSYLINF